MPITAANFSSVLLIPNQRICVGIIEDLHKQILVGKRKRGVHLAECWEFPGGKLESHESFKIALRRELHEELGIHAHTLQKLIEFQHQYKDRHLHFQVFKVSGFRGDVKSCEGQDLQWISPNQLAQLDFPAANTAMLDALTMPDTYMIADRDVFGDRLFSIVEKQLKAGVSLIQYRAKNEDKAIYIKNAKQLIALCAKSGAKLVCNVDVSVANEIGLQAIHLNSSRLREAHQQLPHYKNINVFSASCHNEEEVVMANALGVRCVLIGSVNKTRSHTDLQELGWNRFSQLCVIANCPVYALGGMSLEDCHNARVYGAQGIAAIRAFNI